MYQLWQLLREITPQFFLERSRLAKNGSTPFLRVLGWRRPIKLQMYYLCLVWLRLASSWCQGYRSYRLYKAAVVVLLAPTVFHLSSCKDCRCCCSFIAFGMSALFKLLFCSLLLSAALFHFQLVVHSSLSRPEHLTLDSNLLWIEWAIHQTQKFF